MKKAEVKKGEKTDKQEGKENKKGRGKKIGIILGVVLGVLIMVGGGYMVLKREIVETEELVVVQEGKEFSRVFTEYIQGRLEATELFQEEFRKLEDEEIVEKLAELKDTFSGVAKEVATKYQGTEFEEMAEIMKNDTTVYLKEVRELRQVLTGSGVSADKQVELLKITQENEELLRSAVYLAESAFPEGASGLGGKGVMIVQGEMLTEVGGGVMNVFVGNTEKKVVAVSTDDYSETVKTIRAEKALVFSGGEVRKIGEGVKNELVTGKLKVVTVQEMSGGEAKLEKRLISLLGETTWSLAPKLEARGIMGLTE